MRGEGMFPEEIIDLQEENEMCESMLNDYTEDILDLQQQKEKYEDELRKIKNAWVPPEEIIDLQEEKEKCDNALSDYAENILYMQEQKEECEDELKGTKTGRLSPKEFIKKLKEKAKERDRLQQEVFQYQEKIDALKKELKVVQQQKQDIKIECLEKKIDSLQECQNKINELNLKSQETMQKCSEEKQILWKAMQRLEENNAKEEQLEQLRKEVQKCSKEKQILREEMQELENNVKEEQLVEFETIFKSQECFKIFEFGNIRMCLGHTSTEIISFEQANKYDGNEIYLIPTSWMITFPECMVTLQSFFETCIADFKNKGFLPCEYLDVVQKIQGDVEVLSLNYKTITKFNSYKCFEEFDRGNVKMCFGGAKTQVVSANQLDQCDDFCIAPTNWLVERFDCIRSIDFFAICLEEFKEKGIIPCDEFNNNVQEIIGEAFKNVGDQPSLLVSALL